MVLGGLPPAPFGKSAAYFLSRGAPAPMVRITVAAPVTMSLPAKTLAREVSPRVVPYI
jgi:hypothetical protein